MVCRRDTSLLQAESLMLFDHSDVRRNSQLRS